MSIESSQSASEKKKGLYRITTNYCRLIATMAMGIATVPLQIKWLGMEGFGLLGLVGSSVGIGGMLQDMVRSSMVRELGASWHEGSNKTFRQSYAASFKVCLIVAILTAVVFGIIISIIPLLNIRDEWVKPAQWITGCEGVVTFLIVLFAPAINMLIVREQFFWHNMWTVIRRSAYLISTIIPFLILEPTDLIKGLYIYGNSILTVNCIATFLLIIGFIIYDKRMIPTFRGATKEAMKKVSGTFGWNSSVVLAMNLHERVANFIMNIFFGLWGNAVFSLALRLVSYIRMATLGLTFGLDSVSARLSSTENDSSLRAMFRHSTRMLSFVAFPAMIVVFVLAEPLLRIWIGKSVENPLEVLPSAEILVKIMVLGLTCRAISDGWMKLFYGAGFIRRYAPYVLAGGLFNPLLSISFIYILPESSSFTGAAIAYSSVFLLIHMFIMPKVTSQEVGLTCWSVVCPIFRPLFIAIAASPAMFLGTSFISNGSLNWTGVLISIGSYGIAYGIASWFLMLTPRERKGAIRIARQLSSR